MLLLLLVCSSVGLFVTLGRVEMSGRVSGKQRESKERKNTDYRRRIFWRVSRSVICILSGWESIISGHK